MRPLGVGPERCGLLSNAQARVLIGAEIGPEPRLVVARQSFEPTPEVTPQHRNAADHGRMSWQAVDGHCDIVERRGAHEVLPETSPNPTCPDAFLAGALR